MPNASIAAAAARESLAQTIIDMERTALDRWGRGDPSGFLEISSPDVVYFDPFLERRLNGLAELRRLYTELRGKIHVDRFDMLEPKVQSTETMAVLTFNLASYERDAVRRWNCTEVYRLQKHDGWRIIQTHWSLTKPALRQE
jgi:hypothetical protein